MSVRRILFYTKPGCCLCDQAHDLLLDVCQRLAEQPLISVRNILDDPDLYARYRHTIPVIAIDPQVAGPVLSAPITAPALCRALGLDGCP
jgi:hypothetical protein